MDRNGLCWCGSGKKYKKCHLDFDEKLRSMRLNFFRGQQAPPHEIIKTAKDIEGIKKSAVVNEGALDLVAANMKAGVDTESLNCMAHEFITAHGGVPACLNYNGYPKSICISINDVVCHGIPSKHTVLKEGDIVNVDITTILDGYFSDASRMFEIGKVSEEADKLVQVARKCMEVGIAAAKPWGFVGDIGAAVQNYAESRGYSVVTELGGHGVGKAFHEEPFVAHVGKKHTGMVLAPGMVLTVEPMINIGAYKVYWDADDKWTVRTKDGSLSAQWEHTILITEIGVEVLAR